MMLRSKRMSLPESAKLLKLA